MVPFSRRLVKVAPLALCSLLSPFVWGLQKYDRLDAAQCPKIVDPTQAVELAVVQPDMWRPSGSLASKLLQFVDASPSPYHAVDQAKALLKSKGFRELQEDREWDIQPGAKYYVTRTNTSGCSLTAFAVGQKWVPGNPFSIIATHIDSPCLRLKPISTRHGYGYLQVAVELYGGGLWHTWFDRDLGVAGRVLVRTGPDKIETRLVSIDRPILRVPTLAVHYSKQNPFEVELQNHLTPLLASDVTAMRRDGAKSKESGTVPPYWLADRKSLYVPTPASAIHHSALVQRVAEDLGISPSMVVDFDLCLFDVQKSSFGGVYDEFVFASRLDNLMMTFCGLVAFTGSLESPTALDEESAVRVLTLFDHEEISSKSSVGALSPFLPHTLERICSRPGSSRSIFEQAMAKSFLISADMIHALHPHYSRLHDQSHVVHMNNGMVIYSHPRNTFMHNTPGKVLLREITCLATDLTEDGQPPRLQYFTTPNGVSCGSTLGPLLGTQTGIRSLDVGNCQLSMHSIREMAGVWDVQNAVAILQCFYRDFVSVDSGIDLQ